jgi:hypothetical protein
MQCLKPIARAQTLKVWQTFRVFARSGLYYPADNRQERTMNNGYAIEVQNLKKNFGDLQAVQGVSFAVEQG